MGGFFFFFCHNPDKKIIKTVLQPFSFSRGNLFELLPSESPVSGTLRLKVLMFGSKFILSQTFKARSNVRVETSESRRPVTLMGGLNMLTKK